MTDTAGRDLFISAVKKWASDGLSSQPLGDWYETTNGTPEGFRARPVVGGHLGACMTIRRYVTDTDVPLWYYLMAFIHVSFPKIAFCIL